MIGKYSCWVGIDPGQSGGISFIHQSHTPVSYGMKDMTERDIVEVLMDLGGLSSFAFLEQVSAMPRQGVSSTFKFGQSYGFLRGALIAAKIPFDTVTPGKWQRHLGCLSKGNKNVTKAKAHELFPDLKKVTHQIADSILLAEYCRRVKSGAY